MANEIAAVDRWFYTVLTGDATLAGLVGTKAYGHTVPVEAVSPYLFWTILSPGNDLSTVNATRIWTDPLYAVRYVAAAEGYLPLEAAAAAIDAALHRASGSNVSGTIVGCVRESPFAMPEIRQDGSELRHLGGLYRVFVQ